MNMVGRQTFLDNRKLYSFNVSTLSHAEFCAIRSKIEVLNRYNSFSTPNKVMRIGTRMHELYMYPNKSFNRVLCRARLRKYSHKKYGMDIFSKEIVTSEYTIRVNGAYDDLRIIKENGISYSVLVELKTTAKRYMWSHEVAAAKRQLQIYMWILKDLLDKAKFPLWKRSYVEIYSQSTGEMIKSVPVEYDSDIEKWIKNTIESYMGLRPITIPPFKYCKYCPPNVKNICGFYNSRKTIQNANL